MRNRKAPSKKITAEHNVPADGVTKKLVFTFLGYLISTTEPRQRDAACKFLVARMFDRRTTFVETCTATEFLTVTANRGKT